MDKDINISDIDIINIVDTKLVSEDLIKDDKETVVRLLSPNNITSQIKNGCYELDGIEYYSSNDIVTGLTFWVYTKPVKRETKSKYYIFTE